MPGVVDSHCHLADPQFADDRPAVVERAVQAGLAGLLVVGDDLESSRAAVELAQALSAGEGGARKEGAPALRAWAAVGVHPHEVAQAPADWLQQVAELARQPCVAAIGEIGLDYHYDYSPRPLQKEAFARQLELARELGLPVVVHDREAHGDTLALLQDEARRRPDGQVAGVMHCFSGSWELAQACLRLGMYISAAGSVTFRNARRLQEVFRQVPLERLLVETDSPYLAPEPWRGRRNEPAFVAEVARFLARLRGEEDLAAFGRRLGENACQFLGSGR